ncbi:hypothetical protein ACFWC5_30810 [Streptomyces sp. NPDC060085]|uniref:hypothetical protein n=1 Tax=Streptomyces sp. NPDC060085 TaxID=3347054 RepID=UPI003647BE15
MTSDPDWDTGEGLIRVHDPAEVDAAFERGNGHLRLRGPRRMTWPTWKIRR